MPKLAEELAKDLFDNLRTLTALIARKPPRFDPRWAKSIIEAFSLYTNTSTVNYFVAFGDGLCESSALNREEANRHAILHGDMSYWSKVQTTKVLIFFDLLVKLEPVLRIILGTATGPVEI